MRPPRTALAAVLATLLLAVAACSSTTAPEDATPSGDGAAGEPGGAFPATVTTAFGDVTIPEQPQRVVALGWGDAETALALGVQPVGASDWLGFGGEGVGPWADGLYDSPPEIIDTLEPSFEAIGALEPDLILDVKSSGDPDRYERLSQIAPTVGIPEGAESYLTSMEQQVTTIAAALGEPDAGEQLLAEVEGAFEEAAQAHPGWEGLTVAVGSRTSDGWGAYVEGSERVSFMQRLGFEQSPEIAALPVGASGFSVDISSERLDLLDADLLVLFPIFIEASVVTDDPLWQEIPAVADGRALVMGGDISSAYSLSSVLSVRYAITELVPMIEEVEG